MNTPNTTTPKAHTLTPGPRAVWLLLHPVPSFMTVLVAGAFVVLAARGLPPIGRFLQLLAIEAAMQGSISAFNDYFDRHVDAGRSDKPVAAGAISPHTALLVGVAFGLLALLMAAPLGIWVLALTAIGLGGGLLYDAGLKYTALSWLPFSIAFPTLPLWAWAGAAREIPQPLWWVVPVGGVLALGIHLADTIPDLATDREAGVMGLAHRLGLQRSLLLCWAALAASILLTIALAFALHYQLLTYLPGLVLSSALFIAGVTLYRRDPMQVRRMSLLLEVGAMLLAVGWVAAITL